MARPPSELAVNGGWFALGIGSSVLAGLGLAAGLGVMEASSSSTFCGSCHVMKKYHASWSDSTHRDVGCVECHIPPGLEAKFKKKLEGVSMMIGTLTGTVSAHISASVSDEICLKCHERRLLVGSEWFGNVLFDHRPHLAELRRGVRLTCSSCHSQIVQGSHITVTGDSCLVCHFMKREPEARETECSMCHRVDGMVGERNGRRFDHSRAVELGIDCEACHEPGPMEVGTVPRERCLSCHSRPERLEKYGDIHFLVETHVNESRALCSDCHRDLKHVGDRHEGPDPVRCGACHEPRRTPQLNLYTGLGHISESADASPMYRAGVRCEACHEESPGMTAKPADEKACLRCHPLGVERLFGWWLEAVGERQTIARELYRTTVDEIDPAASPSLRQADLEIGYVERGRGVHNLVLAMSLLDSAVDNLESARAEAGLEPRPPPWPRSMPASECLRCHRGSESRTVVSFGRDFGHAAHVEKRDLTCEKCHSRHEQRRDGGSTSLLLFAEADCQGCHHEQIDLETCGSCHDDLHRAQFAGAGCDDCHVAEFWTPAPGFDHQSTAYPLTGGHRRVACADCHLAEDARGSLVVRYREIAHERCEDCHEDGHANRLGPSCEECHVTDSWRRVDRAAFDHEATRYPLRGGHASIDCERCHLPGSPFRLERFEACADCHQDEHHGQFTSLEQGEGCEPCHSVSGFLPTIYSPDHHQESAYPLRGAHLAVPCDSCHRRVSPRELSAVLPTAAPSYHPDTTEATVQFLFASTACDACHQDPHAGATDDFMRERGCEACHGEDSWRRVSFDHRLDSFPLEGRHRDVACAECHPRMPAEAAQCVELRGVPTTCAGCHENPHAAADALGSRTDDCERCHTADAWTSTSFDHRQEARFPLVAAHSEAACGACHPDLLYEQTPAACRDCHVDPHRGELGLSCERCHTPHSWTYNVEALTTHSATLFPLDGAHATLDCNGCHDQAAPFEFASTPTDCYACHADDYHLTTRPDHALLGLPTRCEDCHDRRSWLGAAIDASLALDHDAVFELAGAHRAADCSGCHAGGYGGAPRDCVGCHLEDAARTVDPDHRLAALPTDCAQCHSQDDWLQVTWSHDSVYGLEGAHRGLECETCHAAGYAGTASDCYSCHGDDFAAAVPDHRAAGFDVDCSGCHNQRRWDRAAFEHQGAWPLTGAHRQLECAACHADGYVGTASDCYGCHRRDYRQVADPDHRAAGFGGECGECHDTRTWSGATLDHDLVFYLAGAHRQLDCAACHADGYTGTSRECVGCHLSDYQSVTDPNHRAASFSTDCSACHGVDSWFGARVDHVPSFPLDGGHEGLECADCHAGGYDGASSECATCHLADYENTRPLDHRAAALGTDCARCHDTAGWRGAMLDHAPYYSLTGAHARAECGACHAGGYAGTARECVACHQADYDSARSPDHRAGGLPADCTLCHGTDRWAGAAFEHWRHYGLTGAHDGLSCNTCHAGGYAGTPRDCAGCHQGDYDAARDPDHRANGFPADCTVCHTTTAWPNINFDHASTYPLSGGHAAADCAGCHAGAYAGTARECESCHLDAFNATTDPDHRVAGFAADCTVCHTTAGWSDVVFDHSPVYPLTGSHAAVGCAGCHAGGYVGTPGECESCHLDAYDAALDPDHRSAGFPLDCAFCHTTAGWHGSSFSHEAYYPLTGTHTRLDCVRCHEAGFSGTPRACAGCHLEAYETAKIVDHEAARFQLTCEDCHSTFSWIGAKFAEHDAAYFPIYSGTHQTLWGSCRTCHRVTGDYRSFSCTVCHNHRRDRMDRLHIGVIGYEYDNLACHACHPTGDAP